MFYVYSDRKHRRKLKEVVALISNSTVHLLYLIYVYLLESRFILSYPRFERRANKSSAIVLQ